MGSSVIMKRFCVCAMILLTHKDILRIRPSRKNNKLHQSGRAVAAGKELEMEKMIAIDTRVIPCEEGYNEKLDRCVIRYQLPVTPSTAETGIAKHTDHEAL
jgi:hypothetical protein